MDKGIHMFFIWENGSPATEMSLILNDAPGRLTELSFHILGISIYASPNRVDITLDRPKVAESKTPAATSLTAPAISPIPPMMLPPDKLNLISIADAATDFNVPPREISPTSLENEELT